MADVTWGYTTLKVRPESYKVANCNGGVVEIRMTPDDNDYFPATILQQGGRDRYRVSMTVMIDDYWEWIYIRDDMTEGDERVFVGHFGETMTAIVESVSDFQYFIEGFYTFNVTFLESTFTGVDI